MEKDNCYYCGKPTNAFAGDPGEWPTRFPHEDEPGVMKVHHMGYVMKELKERKQKTKEDRAHHKTHPIFLSITDMQKPPEELVESIRSQLTRVRGQLSDTQFGYGWEDHLVTAENGLTLVISYLHHVVEEMKKVRKEPPR